MPAYLVSERKNNDDKEKTMIQNKRIVITGGGGFIGVTLAEMLCGHNDIVLYDTNFENNAFSHSGLKDQGNVSLVVGNILDIQGLQKALHNADIVVHMAARVGVQKVINDALNTLEVNYIGASNVLKSSLDSGCGRVVLFSTSEIYGVNAFNIPENGDSTLSSVQDVRWCYSISKLASEHLARSYYRQKGLPVVVVRPFNVFGPKRVGDHVVLRFITRALKNEDLEIYGDGTQIRAWCYITDFCDALIRCMEMEAAVGQSFNIGNSRNTVTIYELARKIIALSGSKSSIAFKTTDFKDIDIRVPNTAKAKEVLDFVASVDLDEGLLRTIEWVEGKGFVGMHRDQLEIQGSGLPIIAGSPAN